MKETKQPAPTARVVQDVERLIADLRRDSNWVDLLDDCGDKCNVHELLESHAAKLPPGAVAAILRARARARRRRSL